MTKIIARLLVVGLAALGVAWWIGADAQPVTVDERPPLVPLGRPPSIGPAMDDISTEVEDQQQQQQQQHQGRSTPC